VICDRCGKEYGIGDYPFCKGGHGPYGIAVIDDQLEGGPRHFETMGDDAPFISTKSEWRREVDRRQLRNVYRHEQTYYDTKRKRRDEERKDTGTNREY
jgi:hypothetical protein